DDAGTLAEQAGRTSLGRNRIVVLGVARLDDETALEDAALRVDLRDADPWRGQRRIVERGHLALRIEGPPDHDRFLCIRGGAAARRSCDRSERNRHADEHRQTPPPRSPLHCSSSRMSGPAEVELTTVSLG